MKATIIIKSEFLQNHNQKISIVERRVSEKGTDSSNRILLSTPTCSLLTNGIQQNPNTHRGFEHNLECVPMFKEDITCGFLKRPLLLQRQLSYLDQANCLCH